MADYDMIAIVGPTASGKTRHAVDVASRLGAEIISADSRQVYRGMDIGTGQDIEEYGDVPYHLVDVAPAGSKYNLHLYLRDFRKAFDSIRARGRMPVMCGGTGLYVESAIAGLSLPDVPENPELRSSLEGKSLEELTSMLASMKKLHNTTDVDTVKRAVRAIEICEYYRLHPEEAEAADRARSKPIATRIIGIDISRDDRRRRITERLHRRLEEGMVDEVRSLIDSGIDPEDLIYYGLEYKFLTLYVIGRLAYDEMVKGLEMAIHQFAKRQMTWFRGMERRGFHIEWYPYDRLLPDEAIL
ncbi:MAG: tRNA (adenosine(37)-N6)-dimethylallyltransferase MiaA [Muribaculaceae bacterium]|nr:tRNA (adenosine(37)-N6)-dimethylallyltransferase MiaA [Muribaculaceae bacterium]